MNWSSGLTWLATLKPTLGSARDSDDDRAGMGTAFGLDASLGDDDAQAWRAGDEPVAVLPWEHRLTRRSGL
ncbi:MAG TPA: hypothetical protein VNU71_16530 [Burkholderiaceae bacterium]|nr:hypothetical protein [Burkholderiaceae bacterium]